MSQTGTVKTFRADKGFGFISASDGTEVFVHIANCTDGNIPVQGDTMTFDTADSDKKPGVVQAINATGGTCKPGDKGDGKGGGPPGSKSGTVKTFNAEKGFGFVVGPDGTDLFCHLNALVDGTTPQPGDTLTFDIEESRSKPGTFTLCNVRGGTGYAAKGKGKDAGKGKGKDDGWGSYGKGDPWAGWGGGKDAWGPYGGGKGDGWGGGKGWDMGKGGWGGDSWGKGGGDPWGKGKGGWGGDSWGGDSWGKGGKDAWGGAKGGW